MRYGKLIDEQFIEAPSFLEYEDRVTANPDGAALSAAGYYPVFERSKPPNTEFTTWEPAYSLVEEAYIMQRWVETPRYIKLDRDKLITKIKGLGMGDVLNDWSRQDLAVLTWWMSDLRYLRGSEMAQEFMSTFNLTQESMELIVSECKEV